MAVSLSPAAKQQFFDNNGLPAAGFKLYTYAAGTSDLQATYQDRDGTVPNANPVVLDARGEATIYLSSALVYDYVLKTQLDETVWTRPGVMVSELVAQEGVDALPRTVPGKLMDFPTLADYATNAASIAAAVANNKVIGVLQDVTINIPADAATLQIALDRLTPINKQATITLHIASGHALSTAVVLSGRDCSQFRITSAAASVPLSAGYSGDIFTGTNGARMPRLACLIDAANQVSGNGLILNAATMTIEAGAGIKNCYGGGLGARNGALVQANGAIFTGCVRSGSVAAAISSWGSQVSAEAADVSGSGYYGAQAAHGGLLSFRGGNASNCFRHGIRASDAAIVDADAATANNCAADTLGYAVYAYQAGVVNFVSGSATGCLGTAALSAYGAGSSINAELATVTGATNYGLQARAGGRIAALGATVSGSGLADYVAIDGLVVHTAGATAGSPLPAQSATIVSGNIAFTPDPRGISFIRLDTEGGAATDNLDTITPANPFTISEGHIVILRTVSSSRDVVLRDAAVSGAVGNYGIVTPSDASITLANSSQIVALVWSGFGWSQMFYAAN